ncbi:MAG: hypothetical protein R3316_03295 [Rhodovibrionaceae bacterium]|nr:hypothetical protein [Rhodovibrionaceae bacterium]
MNLRSLYTLAGLLWGLTIGAMAGIQAAGAAAGALWLFVYGDERWPESAGWILLSAGGAAALIAFAVVFFAARRHAGRLAVQTPPAQRAGRRRGWFLVALAPLVIAALAVVGAL